MKINSIIPYLSLCFLALLPVFPVFADSGEQKRAQLKQTLNQHQGEVVYLDFWASWCGPCRKSFPWMNEMQATYREQGFTVISVNLDKERKLAEQFLQQSQARFPVVYDPEGVLAKQYQLKGMPMSFLLDRQGEVRVAHTGFFSDKRQQYEAEIKHLLTLK